MTAQNRTPTDDSRKLDDQPSGDFRTQVEKFADLARELECDEGFDERLQRIARGPKPAEAEKLESGLPGRRRCCRPLCVRA